MADRPRRGLPPDGDAPGLPARDARAVPDGGAGDPVGGDARGFPAGDGRDPLGGGIDGPGGLPDGGAGDPVGGDAGGLPDADVRALVERLDTLLAGIERATGPVAELAAETVEALALLYGTALARVTALAAAAPDVPAALAGDELLHHLLALHGVHPRPAGERIRRALDDLRPQLHGEEVELAGVEDGVARLRRSGGGGGNGCGRSAKAVERAIGEAVLAAAPELRGVEFMPAPAGRSSTAVIPAESLLRRPRPPTAAPAAATPASPVPSSGGRAARSRGGAP